MSKTVDKSRHYLDDICVIRIILILLLIIYHSLCPYTSAFWDNPQGHEIQFYYWISRLSYSCLLETFVLISGIILGFQTQIKGRKVLSFHHLVVGKLKRLILPSIIFSIIYLFIFMDLSSGSTFLAKSLLEGVGHMWFLPMLFWCFFAMFIISILRIDRKKILPLLFLVAIFSTLPLPLRMSQSMYYLFFFFLGYCVGSKQIDVSRFFNWKSIAATSLIFLITFPMLANFRYGYDEVFLADKIGGGISLKYRLLAVYAFQHFCQLIYSTIGVFWVYITVNYLIKRNWIKVTPKIARLSTYCFGVYIFQEFIIRIFYYKLNVIETLNPYVFPIVSIALSVVLSILLTHFVLKSKIGRFLIG